MEKMCCPNCKTNISRFYIIDQVPRAVKLSNDIESTHEMTVDSEKDPFFAPYSGPEYRVQCGLCGTIENPEQFIKTANLN
jgi:hypothetical protein